MAVLKDRVEFLFAPKRQASPYVRISLCRSLPLNEGRAYSTSNSVNPTVCSISAAGLNCGVLTCAVVAKPIIKPLNKNNVFFIYYNFYTNIEIHMQLSEP